jgi:hypothetical protein
LNIEFIFIIFLFFLQKTDYSEAFQFTPADVAKYLYQTGNFGELSQALSDLVNASIVSRILCITIKTYGVFDLTFLHTKG